MTQDTATSFFKAANDARRGLIHQGPRYAVIDYDGPWPTPPVFAWFVAAADALHFAARTGCRVWALDYEAIVDWPDGPPEGCAISPIGGDRPRARAFVREWFHAERPFQHPEWLNLARTFQAIDEELAEAQRLAAALALTSEEGA